MLWIRIRRGIIDLWGAKLRLAIVEWLDLRAISCVIEREE